MSNYDEILDCVVPEPNTNVEPFDKRVGIILIILGFIFSFIGYSNLDRLINPIIDISYMPPSIEFTIWQLLTGLLGISSGFGILFSKKSGYQLLYSLFFNVFTFLFISFLFSLDLDLESILDFINTLIHHPEFILQIVLCIIPILLIFKILKLKFIFPTKKHFYLISIGILSGILPYSLYIFYDDPYLLF